MFTPVLLWNREHGWVSFLFQGSRAAGKGGLHLMPLLANIGGQAGWVLPWIWVPLVATMVGALRAGPRDERRWFLLCLAAGPVVVFTLVALRGEVGLPHWQAPGYLFLFPALGAAAAARLDGGEVMVRRWLEASVGGFAALVLLLGTHAGTGWMARVVPAAFARGDPTADLLTWSELRPALLNSGMVRAGDFVAAPSWIQAGKAAVGLGPGVPVLCLCADPHHFYYLEDDRRFLGANAVLVVKVKPGQADDTLEKFAPYFEHVEAAGRVAIHRAGATALEVGVYRATSFRRLYPTPQPR
jgi:hypothetical protein